MFKKIFLIIIFSFSAINIFAQSNISQIQATTGDDVQDVKLIFMVDAFKFNHGQPELPVAWPRVPIEPVFRDIEVWSYPMRVRKNYQDRLNVVSLKEKTRYQGSCPEFIADKNVLQNYRMRVEEMKHLKGKQVLVRLICVRGERVGDRYQITSGHVNAMVYDTKDNAWNIWHTEHVTRPLTVDELRVLERIEFKGNFDAIGRF